ncbi:hypothetical protein SIO70_05785 [Chitinophaga sancti]|uniref:hypothetical protein n=1 Tax=Chitinophaga sancti TaxID=1004 RepID=UPI002A752E62|nr:hypothetical protein [Chitinophaga sancti]WPQ64376.1 hypothetical protein SIO70_05785 [Chitinophaga sancti]
MKKFLTGVFALLLGASIAFAQTPAAQQKQDKPKTEAKQDAQKMKKDGTPDKRYKENKETKTASGPKKKDGTPDKRFKENKDVKATNTKKKA